MHRIEETLERGICIGCGACSAATDGAVRVSLGPTRMYVADLSAASETEVRRASRVCPFSDESPNEDELGAPHPDGGMRADGKLGRHSRTFAGRVRDDAYLLGSSSGGLTSWLVKTLIERDVVDAAITVGYASGESGQLFEYSVIERDEVTGNRKSQYYAATMAEVLQGLPSSGRRFAIVGVPCFIRAARALCRERPEFARSLALFVSLVCGHYKTQAFGESLAWQLGVPPDDLAQVDFRAKRLDRGANDYDFAARAGHDDTWQQAPVRTLIGGNWGHSAFQPEACDFCDDVVGETADVSFGDAWLPQFVGDPRGTNVVVSRNRMIDALFDEGAARGEIELLEATAEDVIASQAGGFRHRREGLAIRLRDDEEAGLSVPRKRVSAADAASATPKRVALIRQRRRMARLSHAAYARAVAARDLRLYLRAERAEIARYRRIDLTIRQRAADGAKRVVKRVLALLPGASPTRSAR